MVQHFAKKRSCEICDVLNVEPLLRIEISAALIRPCVQNDPRKIDEADPASYFHGKRLRGCPKTRWSDYISKLACCRLGVNPASYLRLLLIVRYFESSLDCYPCKKFETQHYTETLENFQNVKLVFLLFANPGVIFNEVLILLF